jgi:hypothetical protein
MFPGARGVPGVGHFSNNQAQDQLVDQVQGKLRRRTHLIQLYTNDPDEGPRLISDKNDKGVPIMVIVDPPSCCYYKLNVPHGIVTLEHIWGKKNGQMTPGYFCCYCSYKRIAAMITKNAILFNTPVSQLKYEQGIPSQVCFVKLNNRSLRTII